MADTTKSGSVWVLRWGQCSRVRGAVWALHSALVFMFAGMQEETPLTSQKGWFVSSFCTAWGRPLGAGLSTSLIRAPGRFPFMTLSCKPKSSHITVDRVGTETWGHQDVEHRTSTHLLSEQNLVTCSQEAGTGNGDWWFVRFLLCSCYGLKMFPPNSCAETLSPSDSAWR